MSKDIKGPLKIQADRWHSGAEGHSSGTGGRDVYSKTTRDHHSRRGDALLSSVLFSKAIQELHLEPKTAYVVTFLHWPTRHFSFDQVTAYTSKEMSKAPEAHNVQLGEAPIEMHGEIGTVERYHALLWFSYERITAESDKALQTKNVWPLLNLR